LCVKMNLEIKEKNVALKGHSPPQDENVKWKVHVSFLRKLFGGMLT
jgi:hypothetical protein